MPKACLELGYDYEHEHGHEHKWEDEGSEKDWT